MTALPNLHDGFFDGVWLSPDKRVRFFMRTVTGDRTTIALAGVEALNISGLRAGNIIFDVILIAPEELTPKDIEEVYALKSDQAELAKQTSDESSTARAFGD